MSNVKELFLGICCAAMLIIFCCAAANIRRAHEAACRSNLQQVYQMAQRYAADNDDYIPRMLQRRYHRGTFWCDLVKNYAKDFRYFYCPADEKKGQKGLNHDELLPTRYAGAYVSYGINGHLCGVHRRESHREKITNVENPAYVLYFGDAKNRMLRPIGRNWERDYSPVHENSMLAVMTDGHTEQFNQQNLGTYGKIPGWERDVKRWTQWKE